MQYTGGRPYSVDDTEVPADQFLVHLDNAPSYQIPAPGDDTGYGSAAEVGQNEGGRYVVFYHPGGHIGVWLKDNPYYDNLAPDDGTPTPTFELYKAHVTDTHADYRYDAFDRRIGRGVSVSSWVGGTMGTREDKD